MPQTGISQSASLALDQLVKLPLINHFYLAGGTDLAIQLKHRYSFDLDFFTTENFSEKNLDLDLKEISGYKLDRLEKDTLLGNINDTKISFFRYDNPLIEKPLVFRKTKLAAISDVAAMKLDAIGSRGIKRDFIDLYFICQKKYLLDRCLNFYQQKYPHGKENTFHIIKSLTYFEDAESGEMPEMIEPAFWPEVKKYFEKEAILLAKKFL